MKISSLNIFCTSIFLRNKLEKNKRKIYKLLKNYVIHKLDIKEILKTTNEFEKMKIFTLDEGIKKLLASKPNPFPEKSNCKSIWDNFNAEDFKNL